MKGHFDRLSFKGPVQEQVSGRCGGRGGLGGQGCYISSGNKTGILDALGAPGFGSDEACQRCEVPSCILRLHTAETQYIIPKRPT